MVTKNCKKTLSPFNGIGFDMLYPQFASIYVHNKSLYTCSDSCLRFILCLHFMPEQYVALGG